MVSPGTDAFISAMRDARARGKGSAYAVIVHELDKRYQLDLVNALTEDARRVWKQNKEPVYVETLRDVHRAVGELARSVELDDVPVFVNREGNREYRRKWILVDPKDLTPRAFDGRVVERFFNPIV